MRETLEDLYYGNITPYDRQIRSGTSLMNALDEDDGSLVELLRRDGRREEQG